jgi:hypothetical protein
MTALVRWEGTDPLNPSCGLSVVKAITSNIHVRRITNDWRENAGEESVTIWGMYGPYIHGLSLDK